MKPKLTTHFALIAAGLLSGLGAHAFSLGPVIGSTAIGQPLQVSAAIRFDDVVQQGGSGCVTAELLYGDRLVPSRKVSVQIVPAAARSESLVRVISSELIDEPVVTLSLRAGCREGQQVTRRYVLLPEAAPGDAVVLTAAPSLVFPDAPSALSRAHELDRAERRAEGARARKASVGGASAVDSRAHGRAGRSSSETAVRAASRLQLALWDPGMGAPWLRSSTVLGATPVADGPRRVAALALWQALNARPEDLLRTADRLRGLEGEASSLRSLALNHRAGIASARESVANAKYQGFIELAMTALLALLAGAGAAYALHRKRQSGPPAMGESWYGDLEPQAEPRIDPPPAPAPAPAPAARVAAPTAIAGRVKPSVVIAPAAVVAPRPKLPALPMTARDVADLPPNVPLEFTLPDAAPLVLLTPAPAAPAGLKVEALHGAQQQCEFFVSLGQFDEAVALLSEYLKDSSERPVLAFLELFRIHHAVGDRASYEELQSEFRENFGLEFASFSEFSDERLNLDDFPRVVGRISISWPSTQSLDAIEEFLFRKPGASRDVLSVDAHRDLVWLYGLGQELVYRTGRPAGLQLLGDSSLPNNHFILPWAVDEQGGPLELSLDRLSEVEVSGDLHGFGVDIDLTSLPDTPPNPVATNKPEPQVENAFDSVMESQTRKLFR